MLKTVTRRTLLAGSAAALTLPATLKQATAMEVVSVLGLYLGPITSPWNSRMHSALQEGDAMGQVTYDFAADLAAEEVEAQMRAYAEAGVSLICGVDDSMKESVKAVAEAFPETAFLMRSNSLADLDNIGILAPRLHEAAYLAGMLAGHVSVSGVFGMVGNRGTAGDLIAFNGFRLGVLETRDDARFLTGYADATVSAAEAATAQIDVGADVLFSSLAEVAETAAAREVRVVGQLVDLMAAYPETVFASAVWHARPSIDAVVSDLLSQSPIGKDYSGFSAMGLGGSELVFVADTLTTDAIIPMLERRNAILDGTFTVPMDETVRG